jgi:hypothetical protein
MVGLRRRDIIPTMAIMVAGTVLRWRPLVGNAPVLVSVLLFKLLLLPATASLLLTVVPLGWQYSSSSSSAIFHLTTTVTATSIHTHKC